MLRVPHDVAVVGYDDIVFSAAALLIEELSAPEGVIPRSIVYEPELVIRSSTRILEGNHP